MTKKITQDSLNIQVVEQLFLTTALLKKSGDNRIFKKFDLTTNLYAVLAKIAAGKNSSSMLQEYVEGSPASITQKLNQLENKGIIERKLDKQDKRRWVFEITKKGQQILEELRPVYNEQLAALFDGYKKNQKDQFLEMLKELESRLRS